MLLYSFVAGITVILATFVKKTEDKDRGLSRQRMLNGIILSALFCILTALAALRLEVGNDYGTYVVTAHEIFQRGFVVTERGFNFVVRLLYTLSGKEDHILMFAVFGAAIVTVFLKTFKEQSESFVLTFFLFMSLGIYFRTFNTVRYYFALSIAVYSLKYLVDIKFATNSKAGIKSFIQANNEELQDLIKFLVLIAIAALFHKSVLAVIPMYLICRLSLNKWVAMVLSAFGLGVLIFQNKIMEIVLILYPSYKNTIYIEESHSITENAPIILRCVLVLILCLACYREAIEHNRGNKLYFNMNFMAIGLYVFCYWLPLVTRFGYYLITPHILLVPNVIMAVKDSEKKRRLIFVLIFIGIIYFTYFLFTATNDGVRVLPYKSWLFYEKNWLNQTDTF